MALCFLSASAGWHVLWAAALRAVDVAVAEAILEANVADPAPWALFPQREERWAFTGNRIAVRFAYEWHDYSGQWFRSYGNENWEFDEHGNMARRIASINDLPIAEGERKFRWLLGRRPDDHPGLSDFGL